MGTDRCPRRLDRGRPGLRRHGPLAPSPGRGLGHAQAWRVHSAALAQQPNPRSPPMPMSKRFLLLPSALTILALVAGCTTAASPSSSAEPSVATSAAGSAASEEADPC